MVDDVRSLGSELERSYEVYVRNRLKFRVGSIVFVAFSLDETVMGFAFPKEERAALVGGDPRFPLPAESDMRFNWVHADLAAWTPPRRASSSSRPGGWWCRRRCPGPTTSRTPTALAEIRPYAAGDRRLPVTREKARLKAASEPYPNAPRRPRRSCRRQASSALRACGWRRRRTWATCRPGR